MLQSPPMGSNYMVVHSLGYEGTRSIHVYQVINGMTGETCATYTDDAVAALEDACDRLWVNAKLVVCGSGSQAGGIPLARTWTIHGKGTGTGVTALGAEAGFQEVVIDCSAVEFVPSFTNADVIVLDSMLGCTVNIQTIAASPVSPYAVVRHKPVLPLQHNGTIESNHNDIQVRIMSGSSNGYGLVLEPKGDGMGYNDIRIGSISTYTAANFRTISDSASVLWENQINIARNLAGTSGTCVDVRGGSYHRQNRIYSGIDGSGAAKGVYSDAERNYYFLNVEAIAAGLLVSTSADSANNIFAGNFRFSAASALWTGGNKDWFVLP